MPYRGNGKVKNQPLQRVWIRFDSNGTCTDIRVEPGNLARWFHPEEGEYVKEFLEVRPEEDSELDE